MPKQRTYNPQPAAAAKPAIPTEPFYDNSPLYDSRPQPQPMEQFYQPPMMQPTPMPMQIPQQPVSRLASLQRKFADDPVVPQLTPIAPPKSVADAAPPTITTSPTKKSRQPNRRKGVKSLRIPLSQKIGGGKGMDSATGVNIAK